MYHSLILAELKEHQNLVAARSLSGDIFALESPPEDPTNQEKHAPWLTMQFHPESFLTENPEFFAKLWWQKMENWLIQKS
jgi:anthranilate/para-aminobenzoate synthase component II